MPGSNIERIYLDACCFLAYLNDEEGRASIMDTIFDQAVSHKVRLFTSALSLTEVSFLSAEKAPMPLTDEADATILALLTNSSLFTLVEFNRITALDARQIVRKSRETGGTIKPPDAIHIATAIRVGADAMWTFDTRIQRPRSAFGVPIIEPSVEQLKVL